LEQQAQLVREIWSMFLRRFWIIAFIGGVGVGIAAFVAYVMPPVYESEATILVESQQIPDALARSTVTTGAAERLALIRQRMMTRDNLQRVIEDLKLFLNRNDLTVGDKIELLRNSTELRPINLTERRRSWRNQSLITAFVIKVRFSSSEKAAEIANEFVTNTLNQNLRARTERASDTLEFFRLEEERLSRELLEIESQLTTFKRENENTLPSTLAQRREDLSRIAESQFSLEGQALEIEEKRSSLAIQLSQLKALGVTGAELSPERAQLKRLELELNQKRATFSESHREIRSLKTRIAALEAAVEETPPENDEGETVYSIEEQIMQRKINFLATQLEVLNDQRVALERRRVAIEASIADTPSIEMQLNALNRRQAELEGHYETIIRKRAEAETGEKLEVNQHAERFEVIENALPSETPVSPNRPKILLLGSGAAIGLALALGLFLELMNPAIRSAAQMERKLDLRPVATIPYIRTRREKNRTRVRGVMLFITVAIALPLALFAIDTYYHPIQLLAEKVLDRTGIGSFVRIIEQRF